MCIYIYIYIYIYLLSYKSKTHTCFLRFWGRRLFPILFVGVLMNGTDLFPFWGCNAPLFLKMDNIVLFYDLFHDQYIGHPCMKPNDFNTSLYRFLYDLFLGCKFPTKLRPLPLGNVFLQISLNQLFYYV